MLLAWLYVAVELDRNWEALTERCFAVRVVVTWRLVLTPVHCI